MGIVHRDAAFIRLRGGGHRGWVAGSPSFFRVWLSNVKDTTYLFIHADVTWFGNTPHTPMHIESHALRETDFASQGKSPLTRHWMPL